MDPGGWRWREGTEPREAPVPGMLRGVSSHSGPACPGLWGWAASMNRPVGESSRHPWPLAPQWEKAKAHSQVHPRPPTHPAGFQGEMGLAGAAPTTTNPPGAFRLPESRAGQACLEDPGLPLRLLLGLFPGCRAPSSPTHCADPPKAPGAIHSPSLDSPVWGAGGGGASTKRKTLAVSVTPNEGGGAWIRTAAISRRLWDHGKLSPLLARWMWRGLKDPGQPGATPGGTAPREKSTRQRPCAAGGKGRLRAELTGARGRLGPSRPRTR